MKLHELTAALSAQRPPVPVTLPGVDEPVYIRHITGGERDRYEIATSKNAADFRTRLLLVALSTSTGERLCRDSDLDALRDWPGDAVDALFQAACKVNGIGQDASRDAGND
jgi:hypothetical protein